MNSALYKDMNRSGSALLAVMGIVFLIAIVAASMVAAGRQQVFAAVHLKDYVKAQMIAEAGVNQAYNILKTNFAARLNPNNFPPTSFDGGSYDATVVSIGSNRASITSTGLYQSATAQVKADIQNFPTATTNGSPIPGGGSPYGFAVLAGCEIRWEGNSTLDLKGGYMHANGSYQANGVNILTANVESCNSIQLVGQASIRGIGRSPLINAPAGNISTARIESVPLVSIPNIDLTPYYNVALANGQVYGSGKALSGTVTPPGGVMWVNGNMSFGNGTYNGCFISTSDIELKTTGNGTITITNSTGYPVLASRDSSIVIKQAKTFTFKGLIYAKTGNFDKQGNGDVNGNGAIIAAGNVTKNGGWSGFIYSDPTPVTPGSGGSSGSSSRDKVVITAWQD
jgi:hypothetical protein